ncbi:hypothetical protein D3C80_1761680 [compost metagenome]
MPGAARRLNRRDRTHRNQANPRFSTGQRRFEIKHGLNPALIAEHVTHITRSEIGIEQLIARSLVHKQFLKAQALAAHA